MCRRCTTTGMNKFSSAAEEGLFIFLCLSFLLSVRFYFLISGQMTVTDNYGYYQASMIQAKEAEAAPASWVSIAYSGSLSAILRFTGNRMDVAAYYNIFLQAFSFGFLYFGYRTLFGKAASFLLMLLFSFLPWLTAGVFKISPENYYLCVWSFLLLLLGLAGGRRAGIIAAVFSLPAGAFACLQDMDLWLPFWIFGSVMAGGLFKAAASVYRKRKETAGKEEKTAKDEDSGRRDMDMADGTEGEKKVKYIENPLPLPKKHVKKTMNFKLDEKDDFDIEIDEKDDFDI